MNDIFNTDVPLKTETPAFAKHVLPAVPSSEVYLEDCVKALKRYADKHFDLAIVDPPRPSWETIKTASPAFTEEAFMKNADGTITLPKQKRDGETYKKDCFDGVPHLACRMLYNL